ncbi:MAG: hypothetical protein M1839_008281 [Geoglossum umbratile]|nr:MAG: hypothetical protein M1839_008281 [Geoglossum umbratile]
MSASLPHGGGGSNSHYSGHGSGQRVVPSDPEDEWEGGDDAENEDEDELDNSGEYHDAEEQLSVEFSIGGEEDDEDDDSDGGEEGPSQESHAGRPIPAPMTRRQILQRLGQETIRQLFAGQLSGRYLRTRARQHQGSDEDGDGEEVGGGYGGIGKRRRAGGKYPAIPSEVGRALMGSGAFGDNEICEGNHDKNSVRLASRIFRRELGFNTGLRDQPQNRLMAQSMIPSSTADTIIHYDTRCYSGQFSDDGTFFFSCGQDFRIRLYDTSNPHRWKYYRTVYYPYGQWTVTDASLSPDNKLLACSSIKNVVFLARTDPEEMGDSWLLDFSRSMGRPGFNSHIGFGVWSIRFSGDGRELVAGTSDQSIYVYDLETRQPTLIIPGHDDDVNAVCFADKTSPHVLFSGSDDTTLKVWDRRSMGDRRAAGVFLGHTEGLTYVDSKGDGRYVLSNGKDQTMKLWDIRAMVSTEHLDEMDPTKYSSGFDYRYPPFDEDDYKPHPHDCSLVTFRGHKVLKTLIRCHFSPPTSTNSRYVYTGSFDGKVYIYNLDATIAGVVDVKKATHNSRPRDPDSPTNFFSVHYSDMMPTSAWRTCVRDASWHPNAPIIAATSWNGWGMSTGTCTTHTWNDGVEEGEADPNKSIRVNERLEHKESLYSAPEQT